MMRGKILATSIIITTTTTTITITIVRRTTASA